MSADVQAWVAPRLQLDARQLCHFEDLLLGSVLAERASTKLVNLGTLLAEPNVWGPRGQWVGVKGPLAHWTRNDEAFDRVLGEFAIAARNVPIAADHPALLCNSWLSSFPALRHFPSTYAEWSLCESAAAVSEWKRLRIAYAGARGRARVRGRLPQR